jgi:hypothetical protein
MDWAMLGLFRPLEECVGVSVSAAGALCFIAFWGFALQFPYFLVRDTPFFLCAPK